MPLLHPAGHLFPYQLSKLLRKELFGEADELGLGEHQHPDGLEGIERRETPPFDGRMGDRGLPADPALREAVSEGALRDGVEAFFYISEDGQVE